MKNSRRTGIRPPGPAGRVLVAGLLVGALALSAVAAPAPTLPYPDVQGTVREALQELAPKGIAGIFAGDRFRPDRPITLGEFARLACLVFGISLPASADAEQAAVQALQERGLLPGGSGPARSGLPVSQLELLQAAWRLGGLGDLLSALPSGGGEQALRRLAQATGLMEGSSATSGSLLRSATREQALLALWRASRLRAVQGELESIGAGQLRVQTQRGPYVVAVDQQAAVIRNGRWSSPAQLEPGDRVQAVVTSRGTAAVVVASGLAVPQPWVEQSRAMLRALARQLTPEQWQALLRGDWNGLLGSLTPQVYDTLMGFGIAPWEAEALLRGDWKAVRELANRRVADEAARQLGVSPAVVEALLAQDWPQARKVAQQELLQRLLEQVLGPDYPAYPDYPQGPAASPPSASGPSRTGIGRSTSTWGGLTRQA